MVKRILVVLISFIGIQTSIIAQDSIQWASKVMFVTSESGPLQYSAEQTLHKPNAYPKGGANPNAWRPLKPNKDEYIVVQFDEPTMAQQIAIAETENPGAITKVYAYDVDDNEFELSDFIREGDLHNFEIFRLGSER